MSSHYNLNSGVVEQIMIIIGLLPSLESVGLSIRWVSACSPTILSLFFFFDSGVGKYRYVLGISQIRTHALKLEERERKTSTTKTKKRVEWLSEIAFRRLERIRIYVAWIMTKMYFNEWTKRQAGNQQVLKCYSMRLVCFISNVFVFVWRVLFLVLKWHLSSHSLAWKIQND